jgi:quercetin dioxygenase-like cupin family protein
MGRRLRGAWPLRKPLPVGARASVLPDNGRFAGGKAASVTFVVQSTVADLSCDHRCMEVASINALAAEQLAKAMTVGSGRSSVTVYGRSGARLRQTLVALGAGQVMGEHKSPGDASVLCLQGRVLLRAGESQAELGPGALVALPPQRHDLEALEPSVLLLTVALH